MRSVEVAHVYRAALNIDKWAGEYLREIWAHLEPDDDETRKLVFVDDYPDEFTPFEKAAIGMKMMAAITDPWYRPHLIAFESSCAAAADALAEALPHTEYLVQGKKGETTVAALIREDNGAWTCPALSCIWTLARLGYEPYLSAALEDSVGDAEALDAETIHTVLPTRYIDAEAAVVEMLRQLREPRVSLSRVQYTFA